MILFSEVDDMLPLKRGVLFSFLLLAAFVVQNAGATMLPETSWIPEDEEEAIWHGSSFFDNDFGNFHVRVDYAIYDLKNLGSANGDELNMFSEFNNSEDKKYLYAYHVLTRNDSTTPVGKFSILGEDGLGIDESLISNAGAIDNEDGLAPSDILPNGVWEFSDPTFQGGASSQWLVFASDSAPVFGSFEVDQTGGVVPGANGTSVEMMPAPEPVSILLFGFGALGVLKRRRR
jgi:hypothetical protein